MKEQLNDPQPQGNINAESSQNPDSAASDMSTNIPPSDPNPESASSQTNSEATKAQLVPETKHTSQPLKHEVILGHKVNHQSTTKKGTEAQNHKNHHPSKWRNLDFQTVISALVAFTFAASLFSLIYCLIDINRGDSPIALYSGSDGNSLNFTDGSIAEIANKVAPGVVSILTESRSTNFFGQSAVSSAAGTGMLVTADGYVITNRHVIEDANSINVILDDGTTYEDVKLVGTDPLNDVAYLKINNVSDLPTVTLGDSKTINAGQQVIAIGNALGQFQNTITAGVISGTGRSITATNEDYSASESLTDLIQTDAAINAGNSGGPLVNAAGEVIGINTATSSNADGIGFAIPISSVKGMLKSITEKNVADRAYLGVYYVTLTPDIAAAYDLPVANGAYIYSDGKTSAIIANSPAEKAGLKAKDIITKINGVEVGNAGTVSSLIGEYMPSDTVQFTILRDGKEKVINVTLEGYATQTKKKDLSPQNS